MASLHCAAARSPQSIVGFHQINHPLSLAYTHLDSPFASHRFKNVVRLQLSPKLNKNGVFASNKNPPEEPFVVDKGENGTAKGPPLLTILAGLLVFAAVCYAIGSIVMWLIGLVVN